MDLVSGKTALMGGIGFLLGGGFSLWRSADVLLRTGALPADVDELLRVRKGTGATVTAVASGGAPEGPLPPALEAVAAAPPATPRAVILGAHRATLPSMLAAALRMAAVDGLRAGKMAGAGALVAGSLGLARHGRYSDKLYALRRDPVAAGGGAAAAVAMFADDAAPRHRIVAAACAGAAVAAAVHMLAMRAADDR